MENIIWKCKLDNVYTCKVTRRETFTGILTLTHDAEDKVLLEEDVNLSFGAMYGPDAFDIADWQDKCIAVVDSNIR